MPLDEIIITEDNMCVICLDILDISGVVAKEQSIMTRTPECDCNYYAHTSCFDQWVIDKPTNELSCLVCGSKVELVISYRKRCETCMERCNPPKQIWLLATMGVIFVVYVFMYGP